MKKILLFALLFMMQFAVQAQTQNDAIVRFFDKYMEDERFTVVYVSQKMFEMIFKIETDDPDWNKIREVVGKLKGLRVITADTLIDGAALYKEALSKIPVSEYSELLTVRDGKENVRIWIKDTGNIIQELLLLVGSPDEFVMLSFIGNIDLDNISKLSKGLDVEGVKHLEKIKAKE